MKQSSLAVSGHSQFLLQRASFLDSLARRVVLRLLKQLKQGDLTLVEEGSEQRFGKVGHSLRARLEVLDPAFYRWTLLRGSIGAGEAFMQGYWRCDDLTNLVRIVVRNRAMFYQVDRGVSQLAVPLHRLYQRMRPNTRAGSRSNIAAHYDLGNEFFSLFLDPTLSYSCAIFPRAGATLKEACQYKLERICQKLALTAEDHLLEIGTGWGGFAIYAAANYGCRVTTTTISGEQFREAQARIDEAGLADRIELLKRDYRDLEGQFDKLVSIEMIEAVGADYLDRYLQICQDRLKPGGKFLLQVITIADRHYKAACRSVDFVKRYIFPGSHLPSFSRILEATRQTALLLIDREDLSKHYPPTLLCWRDRFLRQQHRVRALGYPDSFIRMWEFYLCYCAAGFLERHIGDCQLLFERQPPEQIGAV